jgi:hypothetical protein
VFRQCRHRCLVLARCLARPRVSLHGKLTEASPRQSNQVLISSRFEPSKARALSEESDLGPHPNHSTPASGGHCKSAARHGRTSITEREPPITQTLSAAKATSLWRGKYRDYCVRIYDVEHIFPSLASRLRTSLQTCIATWVAIVDLMIRWH